MVAELATAVRQAEQKFYRALRDQQLCAERAANVKAAAATSTWELQAAEEQLQAAQADTEAVEANRVMARVSIAIPSRIAARGAQPRPQQPILPRQAGRRASVHHRPPD